MNKQLSVRSADFLEQALPASPGSRSGLSAEVRGAGYPSTGPWAICTLGAPFC